MMNLALCWPGALFLAALWEGWGGRSRDVPGLWEMLTPEQRERAFNFQGNDTHGDRKFGRCRPVGPP